MYAKNSRSLFRGWAIQVARENVRLGFYFADLIFIKFPAIRYGYIVCLMLNHCQMLVYVYLSLGM